MDFSTIEITAVKVRGNNLSFSTIEITLKKSLWKGLEIFNQGNYTDKVSGKAVEIRRNLVFDIST